MTSKNFDKKDFRNYVKLFWVFILSIPVSIIVILLLVRVGVFGELPSTEEIVNPESFLATEILSSDGNQIGTFFHENRVQVEYNDLPKLKHSQKQPECQS